MTTRAERLAIGRALREIDVLDIDFTRIVRPGDTVMWSQGAAEPIALIRRLMAQRHAIGPFNVFLGGSYSAALQPEHTDVVTVFGMGAVGSNRDLCRADKMHVIPCHLSQLPELLSSGVIGIDVILMQFSLADGAGQNSFGAANGYVQYARARARVSVAEINETAPRTRSMNFLDLAQFDLVVSSNEPIVEVAPSKPSESDIAIARRIADFVVDGSILQVGIGSVPNALLAQVGDRRRMGLHTGIVGDAIVPLMESGAIDNSTKPIHRGKTVTGALAGTRMLYNFADKNPDLLIEPVNQTHSLATLAALKGLVSVNSAVEVDLTGQVNSEVAGKTFVGTVGGQLDFVRGAFAAEGGRSVIGLPARTGKGASRIVARIGPGVVTVPRSDSDIVVTEYGAAELRGLSISQRMRRLIAIAHPDDREQLEQVARREVVGFIA
ncbi:acetyl-CoA hydrolase/transferase family protein [Bradyrhizobium sp. Arg314]